MSEIKSNSRRDFLKKTAAVTAIGALGTTFLQSCGENKILSASGLKFYDRAPDGEKIKVGIIGCGGRGTGALINLINSCPNIEITAMADVFEDKLVRCKRELSGKMNVVVPDENCFLGFDAFKKVLDLDIDLVVLATPPYFRPEHFAAVVEARKHVFMEKPVAVDPVGARSVMASSKRADVAGLKVVVGTQRRHQRDYLSTLEQVKNGAIGDIVSANCYWNQGALWYRQPRKNWGLMESMIRNWANWTWLSGDHIVEQHLHNIDVINWFMDKVPVSAVGVGSRQRRISGDQFDNFSVDFVYDNGIHMHSMCRQINGCANNVGELIVGTKGTTNCMNTISDLKGKVIWKYNYDKETLNPTYGGESLKVGPYDQEMIDLVAAIRENKQLNDAEESAVSAMVAIMGRISAYTGREVTMKEVMSSELKLGPDKISMDLKEYKSEIPVSGI